VALRYEISVPNFAILAAPTQANPRDALKKEKLS
jgi:hypothetical protein